jgi:hypothetical protein
MSELDTIVESASAEEISMNISDETEDNRNFDNPKTDKGRRKAIIPSSHQPKNVDSKKSLDIESNKSDNENEDEFDTFILRHFAPFTGQENVIEWLDMVEKKFNLYKISRSLRYVAIPLLIEGEVRRKYIRNRTDIKSFDDFYEFLLINYDITYNNTPRFEVNSASHLSNQSDLIQNSVTHKSISFNDQQKTTMNNFDLTDNLPPRPILRSTAIVDMGTTGLSSDEPVNRSTFAPTQNTFLTTSNLDQTTYVLRKAIVDNLIKNPKTFQGGKEDVKQWLEEIEQQFDTAQIPDNNKLDLIPYSLRGEARRWYKNNKSTFTSWNIFEKELKEAFLSPFYGELAFKKLESYTQGVNQSVRSFFNEVLKLCAETDTTMSEATKLRHLLNKVKPSIQLEIRKKKPTTIKQFLEYAKETEELFQLANIDNIIDNNNSSSNLNNQIASTVTATRTNVSNSSIESAPPSKYNQKMDYNSYYNHSNHNNNRSNNYDYRSFRPPNPSNWSFRRNNSSYSYNQPKKYNQQFNSNAQRTQYNSHNYSSGNPIRSSYPNNNNNSPSGSAGNNNRVHQVNNISTTEIPSSSNSVQLSSSSEFCTKCQQTGHQAHACSRF